MFLYLNSESRYLQCQNLQTASPPATLNLHLGLLLLNHAVGEINSEIPAKIHFIVKVFA